MSPFRSDVGRHHQGHDLGHGQIRAALNGPHQPGEWCSLIPAGGAVFIRNDRVGPDRPLGDEGAVTRLPCDVISAGRASDGCLFR